jgi:ankyrin repeat protein
VRLLLATPGVDPNFEDWNYQNPLLLAVRNGHDAIVKLLLAHEGLKDPNIPNEWGETSLLVAAELGHEAVVQRLLSWARIHPETTNS